MDFVRIGAALAFLGVALGAFGAHALRMRLSYEMMEVWHTAVLYHLLHALALFALGLYAKTTKTTGVRIQNPGLFFLIGILLFSGSLYALALTGIRPLGAIAPLGGACFLIGWGCLAIKAL